MRMNAMMIGAIAMSFAVAALFFLRFWRETKDRLFGFFAFSFAVLAVNRVAIGLIGSSDPRSDYLYWIRLAAFVIILCAIVDKNRS